MLSIFTIPKPFVGHIGLIQRNAIRSWLALRPECEVILFGNEQGTDSCARQLGVRHVAYVACNEYGTPRLDDVFRQASDTARFRLLCYVNADIILPSTFTECLRRLPFSEFLMVGQRMDVDIVEELDLGDVEAKSLLDERIQKSGILHPPFGSDYFVFPKGALDALPPFVVGRPGWDNWMIFRATQLGIPVVNASQCSTVVHQNHDYRHVPGGSGTYEGPEADYNLGLVDDWDEYLTPLHAGWYLSPGRLSRRRWWRNDWKTATEIFAAAHPRLRALIPAIRRVLRARDRAGRRLAARYSKRQRS